MTLPNRDAADTVVRGASRSLCVLALVIACVSCGDGSRSARGNAADRERFAEALGARLAQLTASPDRAVSLRDVIVSAQMVGRRVRVVGRCLPVRVPSTDWPAGTRHAWQLSADGVAMLVVGRPPTACLARRDAALTLTVVVAEDSLAAIGDLPPAPRRYLVLLDAR